MKKHTVTEKMSKAIRRAAKKVLPFQFGREVKRETGTTSSRLISEKSNFRVQEAYRMARTNLLYSGGGEDERMVFGFTSASPGDGKSLTCANMAISFAMSGKRVLLFDCDMHKPTQDTAFGVSTERGLSEYLAAICEEPEILSTERENLYILPAGHCPPNPAELLYSPRFESLMERAQKEYDCVFVDLPPINLISDATIIAKHVKGYVLVVRAGYSDSRAVQTAVDSIESVGGKIVGFILNGVEDDEGGYYRKYGKYKRYGRYGRYARYGYYNYYGYGKEKNADQTDTETSSKQEEQPLCEEGEEKEAVCVAVAEQGEKNEE